MNERWIRGEENDWGRKNGMRRRGDNINKYM